MKKLTLSRLRALAPQPRKKGSKLAVTAAQRLTNPPYDDYDEEPTTKLSTAFVVVLILHLVAVGGIYSFHAIKKHRKDAEIAATPDLMSAIKSTAPTKPTVPVPAPMAPASPSVPKASAQTQIVKAPVPVPTPAPVSPSVVASKSQTQNVSANKAGGIPAVNVAAQQVTPAPTSKAAPSSPKVEQSGPSAVVAQPKVGGSNQASPGVAQSAQPKAQADLVASGKTHTVQKKENPVSIAKKLGVSQEDLLKLNGIEDPTKLQIGQVLKVPVKKGTP